MSILHDSLERHRRETGPEAGPVLPLTLNAAPKSGKRSGLFSRRAWLLLGGMVLFSLGAWGIVQLWPVSAGVKMAAAPPSLSQPGVRVRSPLAQQGEGDREFASGKGVGAHSETSGADRPTVADLVPDHSPDHRPGRPEEPSAESFLAAQSVPTPSPSVSAEPRVSTMTDPLIGNPQVLDQRALEELNLRLSSLLAALPPSATPHADGPSGPFTERSREGTDYAPDDSLRHAPDHSAQGEPRSMASHAPDPEEVHSPPMVHVSVHQGTEPSHLAGIRPLEEELGRALRARDWAAFDLAYGRLAALQTADALAHWRAARAMAGGDYEEARQLLELLLRDNPFDLRTGLNLALVHEAQGEIGKARIIARNLASRHPLDPGLQALLDRLENTRAR